MVLTSPQAASEGCAHLARVPLLGRRCRPLIAGAELAGTLSQQRLDRETRCVILGS